MKRFPILGVLLLVPALLLVGVVGCTTKTETAGKDTKDKDAAAKDKEVKTPAGKKVEITTPLDATVKGVVKFKGTPPEAKDDPRIKDHKDKDFCLKGDVKEQLWIVSKDGGVANVVISLAPPADKKYKLDENVKNFSKKSIVVDQPFCSYEPHVVALWPEAQSFVAKNSAKINHNVKVDRGALLGVYDQLLTEGKDTGEIPLKGAGETVITAGCSIHPWMSAKVALFNHPYFAVTNEKGAFEIKNVPVDVELTVYKWHESTPSKVEVQKMTFKMGENDLKTIEIGK